MSGRTLSSGIKLAAIALTVLGLLLSSCGDDNITGSSGDRSFTVYLMEYTSENTVYGYNTGTSEVDSFYFPYSTRTNPFVVSPDGELFYLSNGSHIVIIDAESKTAIDSFPCDIDGEVKAISPNGRYIAMVDDEVGIINLDTRSIIYRKDCGQSYSAVFTGDSKAFYYIGEGSGDDGPLTRVSTENPSDITWYNFSDGGIYYMVPSKDDSLWYVFLFVGYPLDYSYFRVYDPINDSTLFDTLFAPLGGQIEVSSDDKNVFFTAPGTVFSETPAPYKVMVYNRRKNSTVEPISTREIGEDERSINAGALYVTPDNQYLLIGSSLTVSAVGVYDIRAKEFVDYYYVGGSRMIQDLIGPPRPFHWGKI